MHAIIANALRQRVLVIILWVVLMRAARSPIGP